MRNETVQYFDAKRLPSCIYYRRYFRACDGSMKTHCYRCGRRFESEDNYDLLVVRDRLLPVCHDDRMCIPRKSSKSKKIQELVTRFHY